MTMEVKKVQFEKHKIIQNYTKHKQKLHIAKEATGHK